MGMYNVNFKLYDFDIDVLSQDFTPEISANSRNAIRYLYSFHVLLKDVLSS